MKDKSLFNFENPKLFLEFILKLNILDGWKITSGTMNNRGHIISNKWYTNFLRSEFDKKAFFRRSVSVGEIVSWLDSFVIMKRVFEKLSLLIDSIQYNEIGVHCEYVIEMSKMMRIDYLITYNRVILLLEFRMVNDFEKIKSTWTKKKSELLIYKELCENYIDKDYKILTFAFVSLYEYNNKEVKKLHVDFNNNQVDFLCEYMVKFLIS